MRRGLPAISALGGAAAFGAAGLSLALTGLGVPFLLAALLSGLCVGLLLYVAGLLLVEGVRAGRATPMRDLERRVRQLEESGAGLRHDLRGVLSPALMMADRLLRNEDPAIRRAGDAVVRSVERATALLAEHKRQNAPAGAAAEPGAAVRQPQSPPAGTAGPSL